MQYVHCIKLKEDVVGTAIVQKCATSQAAFGPCWAKGGGACPAGDDNGTAEPEQPLSFGSQFADVMCRVQGKEKANNRDETHASFTRRVRLFEKGVLMILIEGVLRVLYF